MDIQKELHEIRVSLEAIDFADRIAREGLPAITSLDPLPPGDRCYFATTVHFGRRRSDQVGHLELTSGWLKFCGAVVARHLACGTAAHAIDSHPAYQPAL